MSFKTSNLFHPKEHLHLAAPAKIATAMCVNPVEFLGLLLNVLALGIKSIYDRHMDSASERRCVQLYSRCFSELKPLVEALVLEHGAKNIDKVYGQRTITIDHDSGYLMGIYLQDERQPPEGKKLPSHCVLTLHQEIEKYNLFNRNNFKNEVNEDRSYRFEGSCVALLTKLAQDIVDNKHLFESEIVTSANSWCSKEADVSTAAQST